MVSSRDLGLREFFGSRDRAKERCLLLYCRSIGRVVDDESLKKWASAKFRCGKGFMLKLQLLRSAKEKMYESAPQPTAVNRFSVTVTEAGSNTDRPCKDPRDYNSPVSIWGDGWMRCESSLTEYRFNPVTNRFLAAYLQGYIHGEDNNNDTPNITAGICTKIS
jgi:hypothetical protein